MTGIRFTLKSQLKGYNAKRLRKDLIAGLTVAVMLVPQGMAYALLAGLPPIYGLYAGLVPLFIYPLFGSSRQLSVGPVALVSLLVLAGLSQIAEQGSAEYIQLAMLVAFLAGVIQVILSFLKLGFLVNFMSHPVIAGFTSAAAFIIGFSQLKHISGIPADASNSIFSIGRDLIQNFTNFNLLAFGVGLGSLVIILIIKRIKKTLPSALIVVMLGSLLSFFFNWQASGLRVVGEVPSGLPVFETFTLSWSTIVQVLPLALLICLVSFIESLAISKTIAATNGDHSIDANQELLALGLAKIGGAFFQAYPNTGSFTRSAINDQSGASTGISSIAAAGFVGLTLLFLTKYFFHLPYAVLAAIILAAVANLVDIKEAKHLWKHDRRDFSVFMFTFMITLLLGIQQGVFAGMILSVLFILYKTSKPHYAILGNVQGTELYKNVKHFENSRTYPEIMIFRFDASLYFGNAEFFYDSFQKEFNKRKEKLKVVILDAGSILDIDSTGMQKLILIVRELKQNGITFYLTEAPGPTRKILNTHGIGELIGEDMFYHSTHQAMNHYLSHQRKIIMQTTSTID